MKTYFTIWVVPPVKKGKTHTRLEVGRKNVHHISPVHITQTCARPQRIKSNKSQSQSHKLLQQHSLLQIKSIYSTPLFSLSISILCWSESKPLPSDLSLLRSPISDPKMPAVYGARLTTFEDDEKESEYGYVRKVTSQLPFSSFNFSVYTMFDAIFHHWIVDNHSLHLRSFIVFNKFHWIWGRWSIN